MSRLVALLAALAVVMAPTPGAEANEKAPGKATGCKTTKAGTKRSPSRRTSPARRSAARRGSTAQRSAARRTTPSRRRTATRRHEASRRRTATRRRSASPCRRPARGRRTPTPPRTPSITAPRSPLTSAVVALPPVAAAPATDPGAPAAPGPGAPAAADPAAPAPTAPQASNALGVGAWDRGHFILELSRTTVRAGDLVIDFRNFDQTEHNLFLLSPGGTATRFSPDLAPGEGVTGAVSLTAGRWRLLCTIDGHAATMDRALDVG